MHRDEVESHANVVYSIRAHNLDARPSVVEDSE